VPTARPSLERKSERVADICDAGNCCSPGRRS